MTRLRTRGFSASTPTTLGESRERSSSSISGYFQSNLTWCSPPNNLDLKATDVQVWLIDLEVPNSVTSELETVLSPDELTRAGKFKFARHRRSYTVSHGALRHILGSYQGVAPWRVKFTSGSHGKPALVTIPGQNGLRFNLSHSREKALVAVTRGREIGVDIEYVWREFDWKKLADCFFASGEVVSLWELSPELRQRAFFTCWARKEAYAKAIGDGLHISLKDFKVSLVPGEPVKLLWHKSDPREVSRWSLEEVAVDSDYAAAVAVEGHNWQLKCWRWPAGTLSWKPKCYQPQGNEQVINTMIP